MSTCHGTNYEVISWYFYQDKKVYLDLDYRPEMILKGIITLYGTEVGANNN